jgi:hypothetical protein
VSRTTSSERLAARPPWVWLGLVAAIGLVPASHFSAVDLEDKTTDAAAYLGQAADSRWSTVSGAAAGLLLTLCLLAFLLGVRSIGAGHRPLLADTLTAIGALGLIGLALGFVAAMMAAGGAADSYPFEAVRALGTMAENLGPVMLPLLAGPAALLTVIGLHDRAVPRALAWVSAVFTVLLTLTLVLLVPGAGAPPAFLWLLIASTTLTIRGVAATPPIRDRSF